MKLFSDFIPQQYRSAKLHGGLLFDSENYKVENVSKGSALSDHFKCPLLTLRERLRLLAFRDILDHSNCSQRTTVVVMNQRRRLHAPTDGIVFADVPLFNRGLVVFTT